MFKVNMNNFEYPVYVEKGIINKVNEYLNLNRKVLILTDSGVPKEYAATVASQCSEPYIYTIEQGEKSKNLENYQLIISYMIDHNFTRTDCICAVGGGVCGDLAGFVGSSFMRGITFYNIPTTLLSQVDSSIGGKTGVDYHGLKNIVGAFYPPHAVVIDPLTLNTLDDRLFYEGLAEAIKMAATRNKDLFYFIKNSIDIRSDSEEVINRSLAIKKEVVEIDPKETGLRKILNFGHTFGHAIETIAEGSLLHGECVSIGMMYCAGPNAKKEIKETLEKYHLPTSVNFDKEKIYQLMIHDKKMSGTKISIILVEEIGNCSILKINYEDLKNYL